MAVTPFKKIPSREIYSADISGIQDAINKVETVLSMHTSTATGHELQAVSDQAEPAMHRRIYEGTLRNWLETPAPVVRRGGDIVPLAEYVLYAAQGMVVFPAQQASDAVITADFTHTIASSPLLGHAGAGGAVHALATTEAAGFMSATDKLSLDALDYLRYRRAGLYHAGITASALSSLAVSANNLDILPFYVPVTQTFDRIAINVTTLAAGNARLGIYADTGAVYPGTLVFDAGVVTTGTAGIRALTISLVLAPGLYWLARLQDAAPSLQGLTSAGMIALGSEDLGAGVITGYRLARAYGDGFPNPLPSGAAFITGPRPAVFLRRA
ncbi:MAG: hypothetical protein KGZ50_09370 [Peptococcaceae bacterium]|nr:hypothetical protein [Peptococcaceae bacterium]